MLKARLEAILFASGEPVDAKRLAEATGAGLREVKRALAELAADCAGRGVRLVETGAGWQFTTAPDHAEAVRAFLQKSPPRLSRAQLETLAVVAYRQPVTRAEVDAVRGVRTSPQVWQALMDWGWVRPVGRKDVPGRPFLFGTTKRFLADFGLRGLDELPEPAALLGERSA